MKLITKIKSWIQTTSPISGDILGYVRILYGLFFLAFYEPWYRLMFDYTRYLPDFLFSIPRDSILSFFIATPPSGLVYTICGACVLLCNAFFIVGFFTKTSAFVMSFLIIFYSGIGYSLGKIDHSFINQILPFIYALSGCGQYISIENVWSQKKTIANTWPESWTLMKVLLFLGFFSAGLEKLVDIHYFSLSSHVLSDWVSYGWKEWITSFPRPIPGMLLEFIDYGALFAECVLPFLLFFNQKRQILFCFFAAFFGLFNVIVIGIPHHGLTDVYLIFAGILLLEHIHLFVSRVFVLCFILFYSFLILQFSFSYLTGYHFGQNIAKFLSDIFYFFFFMVVFAYFYYIKFLQKNCLPN